MSLNITFNDALTQGESCNHIETSQLTCFANQLTGLYMLATFAFKEVKETL